MHVVTYILWFIKEIFVSGFQLAACSFKADTGYHPVIVRYPLRVTSSWELFWLTSSITATPGTLSLGLREPPREGLPRIVIVQAVLGDDPAEVLAGIAEMEERLAPHVKELDYGVPGQGSATEADPAFYEYPLESVGRYLRAPELADTEDQPISEDESLATRSWRRQQKGKDV